MSTQLAPSQFVITQAGLAAAAAQGNFGLSIQITNFKLGTGVGYTPALSDTALRGSQVYSASPSSWNLVSDTIRDVVCVLPATAGPFLYGEIGLFLADGTLFALAAWSELQTQTISVVAGVATTNTFHCLLNLATVPAIVQVVTGTSGFATQIASTNFVTGPDYLPGKPDVVIVNEPAYNSDSLLLSRSLPNRWVIHKYVEIGQSVLTSVSVDYKTLTFISPVPNGVSSSAVVGSYTVQDTVGNVRLASSLTQTLVPGTPQQIANNAHISDLVSAANTALSDLALIASPTAAQTNVANAAMQAATQTASVLGGTVVVTTTGALDGFGRPVSVLVFTPASTTTFSFVVVVTLTYPVVIAAGNIIILYQAVERIVSGTQDALTGYVKKSGDTMSGALVNPSGFVGNSSTASQVLNNSTGLPITFSVLGLSTQPNWLWGPSVTDDYQSVLYNPGSISFGNGITPDQWINLAFGNFQRTQIPDSSGYGHTTGPLSATIGGYSGQAVGLGPSGGAGTPNIQYFNSYISAIRPAIAGDILSGAFIPSTWSRSVLWFPSYWKDVTIPIFIMAVADTDDGWETRVAINGVTQRIWNAASNGGSPSKVIEVIWYTVPANTNYLIFDLYAQWNPGNNGDQVTMYVNYIADRSTSFRGDYLPY